MTTTTKSKPILIGIAGGSGSGKTTLATALHKLLGEHRPCIMSFDWYYKDLSNLSPAEREVVNFDHPDALDIDLFVNHLRQLKAGETIETPVYDFTTHLRQPEIRLLHPAGTVLVEGILLLAVDSVRSWLDLKVFIDTPADIRFIRRLTRDIEERGRTVDYGIRQYLTYTRPMHDAYVEPSKSFADMVVSGEQEIETLTARLLDAFEDFMDFKKLIW